MIQLVAGSPTQIPGEAPEGEPPLKLSFSVYRLVADDSFVSVYRTIYVYDDLAAEFAPEEEDLVGDRLPL